MDTLKIMGIILLVILLIVAALIVTPALRAAGNVYDYGIHKIDDATKYETRKEVEDSCRAMQASYEADKQTFLMYRDSDNEEKQGWAESAKLRANKTAATYNQFILKNSFVWAGNVPADIKAELPYLE